jgi:hypothetical protein
MLLLMCPFMAHGQFKFREPPNRQNPAALEEREGDFIWQRFLHNRAIGSFSMEGSLVYRPRGAPSQSFEVEFLGEWIAGQERSTLLVRHDDGHTEEKTVIIRGNRAFHTADASDACHPLPVEEGALDNPLFADLPFSWSDFLMPYLNWEAVSYIGPDRFLGRPAHRFALANSDPAAFPAKVIVTLDEDFAALLKADLYNDEDKLVKRLRIGGFKQFDEEWMFSELSWSNRLSRESVQFKVDSFRMNP